MTEQWDFPVDEPVSMPEWRRHSLSGDVSDIAARIQSGEGLRSLAAKYGISHETLRQALMRAGLATRPTLEPSIPQQRRRANSQPGRGRSMALSEQEALVLGLRHRDGESIRSLARAYGVSHESVRRYLRSVAENSTNCAIAG